MPGHPQVLQQARHTQASEPLLRPVPLPGMPFPLCLIGSFGFRRTPFRCTSSRKPPRLTSCGFHNKLPQTRRLKTIEIHSLTVPEAHSPKSRCQQGCTPPGRPRGGSSLHLPASGGSRCFLDCSCVTAGSAILIAWRLLPVCLCPVSLLFLLLKHQPLD